MSGQVPVEGQQQQQQFNQGQQYQQGQQNFQAGGQAGFQQGYVPQQQAGFVALSPAQSKAQEIMANGLCGCFDDCSICLMGWFCFCILGGKSASEAGVIPNCVIASLAYAVLPICVGCHVRGELQTKFGGYNQGCCTNCCIWCCCPVCAVTQEARAVKALTDSGVVMARN